METLDVLLSDKFVEFASNISRIAEAKKEAKASFEETYQAFKAEMKRLDEEAMELQQEFEASKKEAALNVGDG